MFLVALLHSNLLKHLHPLLVLRIFQLVILAEGHSLFMCSVHQGDINVLTALVAQAIGSDLASEFGPHSNRVLRPELGIVFIMRMKVSRAWSKSSVQIMRAVYILRAMGGEKEE
jgi:hypothetical protein